MSKNSEKSWYLLTSKPRQDAIAEAHLTNQGFTVYRPLAQRLRKRRGKMIKNIESLFPRYLFIHLDRINDNWHPIRSTRGVQDFVRTGFEPAPVPDKLVAALQQQQDALEDKAINLDRFQENQTVILKEGPFKPTFIG